MLVELPVPGRAGEDVALLVGRRGELVEPLLRDVDLALGGAGVDLLEAVGLRLDEARVGERAEDGLAGQADHLAARAVRSMARRRTMRSATLAEAAAGAGAAGESAQKAREREGARWRGMRRRARAAIAMARVRGGRSEEERGNGERERDGGG